MRRKQSGRADLAFRTTHNSRGERAMAERASPETYPECFDPYLRFAISTEFENFKEDFAQRRETFDDKQFRLLLLIELKEAGMAAEFEKKLEDLDAEFGIELGPDVGDINKTRYETMRCRKQAV